MADLFRRNAIMPYQNWQPFPDCAIVAVWNALGQMDIGPAYRFWWGWEGGIDEEESVIVRTRRLDKPKEAANATE